MKKLALLLQLFCIFFLSGQVFATQITLSQDDWKATFFAFDANNNGTFEHIPDPAGGNYDYEDDDSRFAGQFNVDFLSGPGGSVISSTKGFCIDLTESYGNGDAAITGLSGLSNWGSIAWLLDNYWLDTNDSFQNAALQMAVWDTMYGDRFAMSSYGSDDNNFPTGSSYDYFPAIRGYYEIYTAAIGNNTSTGSQYRLLNFRDSQDVIIRNPVPEPSTMMLFGCGLLGIGALCRKRK